MPVFKCILQIIKKNIPSIIMYVGIFIFLAFFLSESAAYSDELNFTEASVNVTVIDRDGGRMGNALKEYLGIQHEIVELPDEKERLQDELYYRNTEYILIVPKGFEQSLLSGDLIVELENIKVPGSSVGVYIDMQIDQYLRNINVCLRSGFTLEQAIEMTNSSIEAHAEVEMAKGYSGETKPIYFFYQYLSYIFIGISISAMGPIMVAFNRQEILRRTESSAFKLRQKNTQLILGGVVFAVACWIIFTAVALVVYPDDMLSVHGFYCLLNSLALIAVAASLSFLTGILSKNSLLVTIFSNIVSLGMAFLCGVFVPQELMSSTLLTFSKFLPVYWYININNILAGTSVVTAPVQSAIHEGILIQLGFVAAIVAVALMLSRYKKMHPSGR